jgi:hypothetical protein
MYAGDLHERIENHEEYIFDLASSSQTTYHELLDLQRNFY